MPIEQLEIGGGILDPASPPPSLVASGYNVLLIKLTRCLASLETTRRSPRKESTVAGVPYVIHERILPFVGGEALSYQGELHWGLLH